jgi:DNA-binding beta-propeller fold protein YncE
MLAVAGCGTASRPTPKKPVLWPGSAATHPGRGPSRLAIATDTAVLPLNLLIAEADGRLVSISPHGQVVWGERQRDPAAVFVSATGRTEIVTESLAGIVVLRRIDSGAIASVYRAPLLQDPRTAVENSAGEVVIADAGACSLDFVRQGAHRASHVMHWPAGRGCPQAVIAADGRLVVTLKRPDAVAVLALGGAQLAYVSLHGIAAPSDAGAYGAGGLIVADRVKPGRVAEIDGRSGAVVWSYGPRAGSGELNRPTLATVLPDGDVLVVDSGNSRVIVLDHATKRIVWQYGHAGIAASRPGYLDEPTTATLVPFGGI